MLGTELAIDQAINEGIPITLCINKIDRLILELKLPVEDAYHKLRHTVDSVNKFIQTNSKGREGGNRQKILSPERGNVLFACAHHGWNFTLNSFAKKYIKNAKHNQVAKNLSSEEFAKRLWGDAFYNRETGKFKKS